MREVILDFETTVVNNKSRVWLWTYAVVEDSPHTKWGLSIDSMLYKLCEDKNTIYYFHNLSFDGIFILDKLLSMGYKQVFEKDIGKKEFNCSFINNTMYSITFYFNGHKFLIKDSLKIIPLPVDDIPKTFGFADEITKGTIDYEKERGEDYIPTKEEIDYGLGDTIIVAKGLKKIRDAKLKKYTTASNALTFCKTTLQNFDEIFPELDVKFISEYYPAYRGGLSFVNEKYANIVVTNGLVLDVNSEYPWAMEYCKLPYGLPVDYETDIYFVKLKVKLRKKDRCPNFLFTNGVQQHLFKDGNIIDLVLTSIDYENMHKYYYVDEEVILEKIYFEGKIGILSDYIEYWKNIKIQAEKEGNAGLRYIAKLMLNSLYGKFGAKWFNLMSEFAYDENGIVSNIEGHYIDSKTIYMPLAAFVTAYGRNKLVTAIYELMQQDDDNFWYCDTDSVHMKGRNIPNSVVIHPTDFGCWKAEFEIKRARYIHSKCYIEEGYELNGEMKRKSKKLKKLVKCCGLPATFTKKVKGVTKRYNTRDIIKFDDFKKGAVFKGIKLKKKNNKGGCYLERGDFTIR